MERDVMHDDGDKYLADGDDEEHVSAKASGEEDRRGDDALQPAPDLDLHTPRLKWKPPGSRCRRHDGDDDYEEEEEEEEEEDLDPDVDEEEEDESQDEEPEEVEGDDKATTNNHSSKRKPAAGCQHRKQKRKCSRVSKGKTTEATSASWQRKRWLVDVYEDEDKDADFIVKDDQDEENHGPRNKTRAVRKTRDGTLEPYDEAATWPAVESDTPDFEFVMSAEEPAEKETPAIEPAKTNGKKGNMNWGSGSKSPSDFDYVISEGELKNLGVSRSPQTASQSLTTLPRQTFLTSRAGEKGKEVKEPEEAWKQICGICLSEEQRATIQGMLSSCSHYFCFACIMQWSKVESRCPLCKRRFATITKSSMENLGLGSRKSVIMVEKRDQVYQPTEEEMRHWLHPFENVVCTECNCGGDDNLMLVCDICDSSAHTYCVGLGREVPEGNWCCGVCRSGGEGPSNAQAQDRVVHCRESNTNHVNSNSGSFGLATSSGVFQRPHPQPINTQPSPQGFDLNLSPRETLEGEREELHVSAHAVSTTLDSSRAFDHTLQFSPRGATNVSQNPTQRNRTIPENEQNQQSMCAPTEVNPSCSRDNYMQNQQSSSPFVQPANGFIERTYGGGEKFQGAKYELIPFVKRNVKQIWVQSPFSMDESAFKNIARRATHTILALSGIAHNRDMYRSEMARRGAADAGRYGADCTHLVVCGLLCLVVPSSGFFSRLTCFVVPLSGFLKDGKKLVSELWVDDSLNLGEMAGAWLIPAGLMAWEILPVDDYTKSGWELEIMMAQAKDSEDEEEAGGSSSPSKCVTRSTHATDLEWQLWTIVLNGKEEVPDDQVNRHHHVHQLTTMPALSADNTENIDENGLDSTNQNNAMQACSIKEYPGLKLLQKMLLEVSIIGSLKPSNGSSATGTASSPFLSRKSASEGATVSGLSRNSTQSVILTGKEKYGSFKSNSLSYRRTSLKLVRLVEGQKLPESSTDGRESLRENTLALSEARSEKGYAASSSSNSEVEKSYSLSLQNGDTEMNDSPQEGPTSKVKNASAKRCGNTSNKAATSRSQKCKDEIISSKSNHDKVVSCEYVEAQPEKNHASPNGSECAVFFPEEISNSKANNVAAKSSLHASSEVNSELALSNTESAEKNMGEYSKRLLCYVITDEHQIGSFQMVPNAIARNMVAKASQTADADVPVVNNTGSMSSESECGMQNSFGAEPCKNGNAFVSEVKVVYLRRASESSKNASNATVDQSPQNSNDDGAKDAGGSSFKDVPNRV
ncbi:hypothetical protein GUJ93_ZPchr0007g3747, partial [Zizania palustris]